MEMLKSIHTQKMLNEVYLNEVSPITYLSNLGVIKPLEDQEYEEVFKQDDVFAMNYYIHKTTKPSDYYVLDRYVCNEELDFYFIARPKKEFQFVYGEFLGSSLKEQDVILNQQKLKEQLGYEKGMMKAYISMNEKGAIWFDKASIPILDEILYHHFGE